MNCFLCGKEISWLRSTVDRQYCCDEHRREARLAATQVLQEEEDERELWTVARAKKARSRGPSATPVLLLLALTALILAMTMSPGKSGSGGGGNRSAGPKVSLDEEQGLLGQASGFLGSMVRDRAPVTLHHDFTSTGLKDWTLSSLQGGSPIDDPHDWKRPGNPSLLDSNLVPPGSLRIWSKSTTLHNYQMEFAGQLQKRSLSWAFRATDAQNYYAAKIVITKPGPQPNAGLVHYAMLNGREWDRVQLPLPLTLEQGADYRVRVSVQDNRFVTYLNGRVISSWKDDRLSHGGIGFFADGDDQEKVAWVSISERDSFLGRMLSQFGLFILPGAPLPGTPIVP